MTADQPRIVPDNRSILLKRDGLFARRALNSTHAVLVRGHDCRVPYQEIIMNEITSTQTVPQPVTTGTSGVQQVTTENGTSVSSSTSLQYGGGYFVMPSLVSMGLLTPTAPRDLEAYWLELT